MATYTEDEIYDFWRRWDGKDQLVERIIKILKGSGFPQNIEELTNRIEEANELLFENGFTSGAKEFRLFSPSFPLANPIIPRMNLRGIHLVNKDCRNIVLAGANLEGAELIQTDLENGVLSHSFLEKSKIHHANLTRAEFYKCHLEMADFERSNCYKTIFRKSHLEGTNFYAANLVNANLQGAFLSGANFYKANMSNSYINKTWAYGVNFKGANFISADLSLMKTGALSYDFFHEECSLSDNDKEKLSRERRITDFSLNEFLTKWRNHFYYGTPLKDLLTDIKLVISFYKFRRKRKGKKIIRLRDELKVFGTKNYYCRHFGIRINLINLYNHNFHRWFLTKFIGTELDNANMVLAKDLKRYADDQQFLYMFKKRHCIIYGIWKLFSDCGGKLSVVFFWSLAFVGLFALLYGIIPSQPINPEPFFKYSENLTPFWKWIYVSFDIFSNLGIRSTYPNNPLGVILMIFESVLGFMMLGMLISVLANRFARRS
ncbi:hypothetical protein CEE37_09440 [candidate division LCP-89 bacterium B3_LCP]|uniref:Potassium channel domain-containing protein n=1 Tax=candidate division LCP-89 bacterium B3_LCP TaxID=2012998 RepID=A0A532UYD5_UNCL8|nr:MAG: hypothetical protein CEE37_09440 [candidate division LCP-89 bacterium B3_LCP]